MSDHDRALAAAKEALLYRGTYDDRDNDELARDCVAAYLDSLLEGLPAESIERAAHALGPFADQSRDHSAAEAAIETFLRSLRTGLEGER